MHLITKKYASLTVRVLEVHVFFNVHCIIFFFQNVLDIGNYNTNVFPLFILNVYNYLNDFQYSLL